MPYDNVSDETSLPNVAVNKYAYQQGIAWGGDAQRAVDGNT